jgi:hypothetical protein
MISLPSSLSALVMPQQAVPSPPLIYGGNSHPNIKIRTLISLPYFVLEKVQRITQMPWVKFFYIGYNLASIPSESSLNLFEIKIVFDSVGICTYNRRRK